MRVRDRCSEKRGRYKVDGVVVVSDPHIDSMPTIRFRKMTITMTDAIQKKTIEPNRIPFTHRVTRINVKKTARNK